MITAAHAFSASEDSNASLSWILGDARFYEPDRTPDVAVCIGAEWVWHDFNGTVRALANRLGDGGVAVVGAARLHHSANADQVLKERGRVDTIDDMRQMLATHGLEPLLRIDPDDAGWDAYLARTATAATEWAALHPGSRSDQWLEEQADWQAARERDRDIIGWSVWAARKHRD